MADWDLHALLLRLIDLDLRGLQWQNAGKGPKPKPVELPDSQRQGTGRSTSVPDVVRRLRDVGQIPSDVSD
jgi:hypothetical protein